MNIAPQIQYSPTHAEVSDAQMTRDIHRKGFCSIHNDIRIWEYQTGSVFLKHKIYKECSRCAENFKNEMQQKIQQLQITSNNEDSKTLQEAIAALEREKARNDQLQEDYFALFQQHEEIVQKQKKAEADLAAQVTVAEHYQNQKLEHVEKVAAIERSGKPGQVEVLDHVFKVLLIGDPGVGKSSILVQFTDGYFNDNLQSTIGVDFKVKVMDALDPSGKRKRIKVTIWDTAGQERFRTLTSSYYRGAQAIILVYDVSLQATFDSLNMWLQEVEQFSMGGGKEVVKLLVGNKVDKPRAVLRETARNWACERGMLFMECSAKTREGIGEIFYEVIERILENPTLLMNTRPAKPTRRIESTPAGATTLKSFC
jgi:Ras-related protein Rab-18